MNHENYQEFRLNGMSVTLKLDTKRHVWQIWFGSIYGNEPRLEFTRAKGEAIIKFLEGLQNVTNIKK